MGTYADKLKQRLKVCMDAHLSAMETFNIEIKKTFKNITLSNPYDPEIITKLAQGTAAKLGIDNGIDILIRGGLIEKNNLDRSLMPFPKATDQYPDIVKLGIAGFITPQILYSCINIEKDSVISDPVAQKLLNLFQDKTSEPIMYISKDILKSWVQRNGEDWDVHSALLDDFVIKTMGSLRPSPKSPSDILHFFKKINKRIHGDMPNFFSKRDDYKYIYLLFPLCFWKYGFYDVFYNSKPRKQMTNIYKAAVAIGIKPATKETRKKLTKLPKSADVTTNPEIAEYQQEVAELKFEIGPIRDNIDLIGYTPAYDYPMIPVNHPALIPQNVECHITNMFSTIRQLNSATTTFQFLGSSGVNVNLNFMTMDEDAVKYLTDITEYCNTLARNYRYDTKSGYLNMLNWITLLMGAQDFVITNLTTTTVPNQPDCYDINLSLTSFEKSLRKETEIEKFQQQIIPQESSNKIIMDQGGVVVAKVGVDPDEGLKEHNMAKDDKNKIGSKYITYDEIEEKLNTVTPYPDLELPTIDNVITWLKEAEVEGEKINSFDELYFSDLKSKGNHWADPDWFIKPHLYVDKHSEAQGTSVAESLYWHNKEITSKGGKTTYEITKQGFLDYLEAQQVVALPIIKDITGTSEKIAFKDAQGGTISVDLNSGDWGKVDWADEKLKSSYELNSKFVKEAMKEAMEALGLAVEAEAGTKAGALALLGNYLDAIAFAESSYKSDIGIHANMMDTIEKGKTFWNKHSGGGHGYAEPKNKWGYGGKYQMGDNEINGARNNINPISTFTSSYYISKDAWYQEVAEAHYLVRSIKELNGMLQYNISTNALFVGLALLHHEGGHTIWSNIANIIDSPIPEIINNILRGREAAKKRKKFNIRQSNKNIFTKQHTSDAGWQSMEYPFVVYYQMLNPTNRKRDTWQKDINFIQNTIKLITYIAVASKFFNNKFDIESEIQAQQNIENFDMPGSFPVSKVGYGYLLIVKKEIILGGNKNSKNLQLISVNAITHFNSFKGEIKNNGIKTGAKARNIILTPIAVPATININLTKEESVKAKKTIEIQEDFVTNMAKSLAPVFDRFNNPVGRLVRAFPSFMVNFIDEGRSWFLFKMHDNIYSYNALIEFQLMRDRQRLDDVLVMSLSNTMGEITSQASFMNKIYAGGNYIDSFPKFISRYIHPAKTIKELEKVRALETPKLILSPGNRVHLRIGYGANFQHYKTIFNGTITEIGVDTEVNIVAQGDGMELANEIKAENVTLNNLRISSIFEALLSDRGSLPSNISAWGTKNLYENLAGAVGAYTGLNASHPLGIRHFGLWRHPSPTQESVNDKEILQNIYMADKEIGGVDIGNGKRIEGTAWWRPVGWWNADKGDPKLTLSANNLALSDMFDVCADAACDYIFQVEPFEYRSTIFYGLPHYEYTYRYGKKADTQLVGTATTFSQSGLKTTEKPTVDTYKDINEVFSKFHYYDSCHHIIGNTVKASKEGVFTNVRGVYGGEDVAEESVKTQVVKADWDIDTDDQTYMVTNTGLAFKGWAVLKYIPYFNNLKIERDNIINERICASRLRDSLKLMYKGELIIWGDPTVKPYDTFKLQDEVSEMNGIAGVRRVIHKFSMETGFITSITPDAFVVVDDRRSLIRHNYWVQATAVAFAPILIRFAANAVHRGFTKMVLHSTLNIMDYLGTMHVGNVDKLTNLYQAFGKFDPADDIARKKMAELLESVKGITANEDTKKVLNMLKEKLEYEIKDGKVELKKATGIFDNAIKKKIDDDMLRIIKSGNYQRLSAFREFDRVSQAMLDKIIKEIGEDEANRVFANTVGGILNYDPENVVKFFGNSEELKNIIALKRGDVNEGIISFLSKSKNQKLVKDMLKKTADKEILEALAGESIPAMLTKKANTLLAGENIQKLLIEQLEIRAEELIEGKVDLSVLKKVLGPKFTTSNILKETGNFMIPAVREGILKKALFLPPRFLVGSAKFGNLFVGATGGLAREVLAGIKTLPALGKLIPAFAVSGPVGALAFVAEQALMFLAFDTVAIMASRFIRNQQAVTISPLQLHGMEFSAGIKGHAGSVVNDPNGMLDNLIIKNQSKTFNWVMENIIGVDMEEAKDALISVKANVYTMAPGVDPYEKQKIIAQNYGKYVKSLPRDTETGISTGTSNIGLKNYEKHRWSQNPASNCGVFAIMMAMSMLGVIEVNSPVGTPLGSSINKIMKDIFKSNDGNKFDGVEGEIKIKNVSNNLIKVIFQPVLYGIELPKNNGVPAKDTIAKIKYVLDANYPVILGGPYFSDEKSHFVTAVGYEEVDLNGEKIPCWVANDSGYGSAGGKIRGSRDPKYKKGNVPGAGNYYSMEEIPNASRKDWGKGYKHIYAIVSKEIYDQLKNKNKTW